MAETPHMIQQIIKYSDGTETVINYRGVIENGILHADDPKDAHFEPSKEEAPSEEVVEKKPKKKKKEDVVE